VGLIAEEIRSVGLYGMSDLILKSFFDENSDANENDYDFASVG
jgi:hypothetical protein